MIGRSGYQMLNFNGVTLDTASTVTIKGVFKAAKSGLPILIKGVSAGGNSLTGFTYDSDVEATDNAILPIILVSSGTPVVAYITISNTDAVSITIG